MIPSKHPSEKIIPLEAIAPICADLKSNHYSIATLNGSFDLVHAGHIYMIEEAAKQADVLILALNSDESIQQYKSADRPIIPLKERLALLSAFEMIDYLTWFDETTPEQFLKKAQPTVHVNGQEYGTNCLEAPLLRQLGTRLHLVPRLPGLSTSDLIRKIQHLSN